MFNKTKGLWKAEQTLGTGATFDWRGCKHSGKNYSLHKENNQPACLSLEDCTRKAADAKGMFYWVEFWPSVSQPGIKTGTVDHSADAVGFVHFYVYDYFVYFPNKAV